MEWTHCTKMVRNSGGIISQKEKEQNHQGTLGAHDNQRDS